MNKRILGKDLASKGLVLFLCLFSLAIITLRKRELIALFTVLLPCVCVFVCVLMSLPLGAMSWSMIVAIPGHSLFNCNIYFDCVSLSSNVSTSWCHELVYDCGISWSFYSFFGLSESN